MYVNHSITRITEYCQDYYYISIYIYMLWTCNPCMRDLTKTSECKQKTVTQLHRDTATPGMHYMCTICTDVHMYDVYIVPVRGTLYAYASVGCRLRRFERLRCAPRKQLEPHPTRCATILPKRHASCARSTCRCHLHFPAQVQGSHTAAARNRIAVATIQPWRAARSTLIYEELHGRTA